MRQYKCVTSDGLLRVGQVVELDENDKRVKVLVRLGYIVEYKEERKFAEEPIITKKSKGGK